MGVTQIIKRCDASSSNELPEFDLERMFEEELMQTFSSLQSASHQPDAGTEDQGPDSVIEYYHQSMASGTRIREKLSEALRVLLKPLLMDSC